MYFEEIVISKKIFHLPLELEICSDRVVCNRNQHMPAAGRSGAHGHPGQSHPATCLCIIDWSDFRKFGLVLYPPADGLLKEFCELFLEQLA